MPEMCEHCGGPLEVSNCRFEGCLKCWDEFMEAYLEVERNGQS